MRTHPTKQCCDCGGPISYAVPTPTRCRKCNDNNRKKSVAERFWKYVEKTDGCWNWLGSKTNGYGQLSAGNNKSPHKAYRISWEIHHNLPIPEGLEILHDCPGGDNPGCVNPAHLKLGTHSENMKDAFLKGQMQRGEDRFNAKLTEGDVRNIRLMYIPWKFSQSKISKIFKVSRATIEGIILRKTWHHVS